VRVPLNRSAAGALGIQNHCRSLRGCRPVSSSAPYSIRTFGVVVPLTSTKPPGHRPAKTSRIELRATEDDRDLLDRAAAALGTDRSSFLLTQGRLAAQRVLADREHFLLDADAQQEWERINSRPARSLPGLARLLERPSPFVTPAADQPQA
jgi:uncharacterized protein (DUF1778 family)